MAGSKASSRRSHRRERAGPEMHQASAQHKRVISQPDRVEHFLHRKTPEVQQDISQTYEDANMLASIHEGGSEGVKRHKISHRKSQGIAVFDYPAEHLQYEGD